ncbi:hypothetical protein GCM10009087_19280 [Sphingomonas oligophenolica]
MVAFVPLGMPGRHRYTFRLTPGAGERRCNDRRVKATGDAHQHASVRTAQSADAAFDGHAEMIEARGPIADWPVRDMIPWRPARFRPDLAPILYQSKTWQQFAQATDRGLVGSLIGEAELEADILPSDFDVKEISDAQGRRVGCNGVEAVRRDMIHGKTAGRVAQNDRLAVGALLDGDIASPVAIDEQRE